jgi:hypothetical protein
MTAGAANAASTSAPAISFRAPTWSSLRPSGRAGVAFF